MSIAFRASPLSAGSVREDRHQGSLEGFNMQLRGVLRPIGRLVGGATLPDFGVEAVIVSGMRSTHLYFCIG